MPKIKFSALVSGMSGKSNGSVFGSNNGGAYFRNNTSKTKTKTALNAKRKSLFSEVSGAWRGLSSEQQDTWRNAVSNYVVQNVFGDNRTPTGYELFMRLNNVRLEQGSAMLLEAPVPRSLPSLNDLELDFPDLFLYMPTIGLLNFDKTNQTLQQYYVVTNAAESQGLFTEAFFQGQFSFGNYNQNIDFYSVAKGLFSCSMSGGGSFEVSIECDGSKFGRLRLTVEGGSGSIIVESNDFEIDLTQTFTIGIAMGSTDRTGVKLFYNGVKLAVKTSTAGTFTAGTFGAEFQLFYNASTSYAKMICSDFRQSLGYTDETNMTLQSAGYIIGDESVLYQMSDLNENLEIENFNTAVGGTLAGQETISRKNNLSSIDQNRLPKMTITTTSSGSSGMRVYIYATPCISFGRVTSTPNKKLLSVMSYEGETSWAVSDLWQNLYGRFSPNGYIQYFLFVSDSTTGVVNAAAIKPPKRKRFKAGAELSGAVS